MINNKIIAIDARMIEMSGIGIYIQHLMGQGIYDYALGVEKEVRKYDKKVNVIPFDAPIYRLKEQVFFPNKEVEAAGISLIHFPHYNVPITYHGDYVVTVHDLTHIILPELVGSKIKQCYARILMKNAVTRSKLIFTVSKNSKEDIIKYFDIKKEKVSITYDAVDNDFVVKSREKVDYLYKKYSIPRNKKLVLYVGNLKPHKNLAALLNAIKRIGRRDIILILTGKAFKSVDLDRQENEMGIKDSVIHTGSVTKEELVDFYNLADVFVFPSLYEGFGIPPLEAMACGTPVACSNRSSIPEVVGDAALLFDPQDINEIANTIIQILDNQDISNKLIEAGRVRCRSFTWGRTAETVKNSIERVI